MQREKLMKVSDLSYYFRAMVYSILAALLMRSAYAGWSVYRSSGDGSTLFWVVLTILCAIASVWQVVRAIRASRAS